MLIRIRRNEVHVEQEASHLVNIAYVWYVQHVFATILSTHLFFKPSRVHRGFICVKCPVRSVGGEVEGLLYSWHSRMKATRSHDVTLTHRLDVKHRPPISVTIQHFIQFIYY